MSASRRRAGSLHGAGGRRRRAGAWRCGPLLAQVADGARAAAWPAPPPPSSARCSADGRRRAVFPFDDAERLQLALRAAPAARALPFKDMRRPARAAAHELMKASLSAVGLRARRSTSSGSRACCASSRRSAGSCAIPRTTRSRVFGTPGAAAPVGLAARGPSPLAQLHAGARQAGRGHPGLLRAPTRPRCARARSRACARSAREQDLGRALARGMDDAQRAPHAHRRPVAGRHRRPAPGAARAWPRPPACRSAELTRRPARALAEARRGVRAEHARARWPTRSCAACARPGSSASTSPGRARIEPGHAHYYRHPRADAPDRVRQHAERRQPHPLRLARPAERLRRRPPPRPLRARPPPPRLTEAVVGARRVRPTGRRRSGRRRPAPVHARGSGSFTSSSINVNRPSRTRPSTRA